MTNDTTLSDKERAAQYRDEMSRALSAVIDILDRAKQHGLVIGFNIGLDPVGRNQLQSLTVVRHY